MSFLGAWETPEYSRNSPYHVTTFLLCPILYVTQLYKPQIENTHGWAAFSLKPQESSHSEIFEGADNMLTRKQTYTWEFHCQYHLQHHLLWQRPIWQCKLRWDKSNLPFTNFQFSINDDSLTCLGPGTKNSLYTANICSWFNTGWENTRWTKIDIVL